MKKNINVLYELFPTTIVICNNENYVSMNSKLLDLISKEKFNSINCDIDRNSPHFNYSPEQTIDNHLEKRDEYSEFFSWIQICLNEYKDFFKIQTKELKVVLSWINKGNQYTNHEVHYHLNSYISGVYYISENPSPTYFKSPITAKNTGIHIISDILQNDYDTWVSPATAGQLILFPSWLSHYTKSQSFEGNRYTLSFNVMPVGLTNPGTLIECFY